MWSRVKLMPLGEEAVQKVCGYGQVDAIRAAYSDDHRVVLYAEDELPYDHFAVYELPIPELFHNGGRRTIRITLAFDPPVRHARADYAGVKMNFRLVRGCAPALILDHFRRRTQDEGPRPDLGDRYNCALEPGPRERERGTLQSASVCFSRGTEVYGDIYHLVVRCEGGWASSFETHQRFAVVRQFVSTTASVHACAYRPELREISRGRRIHGPRQADIALRGEVASPHSLVSTRSLSTSLR